MAEAGRHAEKFHAAQGFLPDPVFLRSIGIDARPIYPMEISSDIAEKIAYGDIKAPVNLQPDFKGEMRGEVYRPRQISLSAWVE